MSSSNEPGNSFLRWLPFLLLGGLIITALAAVTAALLVVGPEWLPLPGPEAAEPVALNQATPRPTFTATSLPSPSATATGTSSPAPTVTPAPTETPPPTTAATATASPAPLPTDTLTPPPPPTDTPIPEPPPVDFVVTHTRMRTNEENSWDGKVANNCGGDHTIYVQVVDAAGQPLSGLIVGDTYKNVRAASGQAGPGKLSIKLWSNTMSLEVQGHVDGTPYTSEQTLPLSTRDEDIPAEWLFAGGYCESIANCQLRQQTNGLCRGHYSYDVTFQRTW